MKNAIITGSMAVTILLAGCCTKEPKSPPTRPPTQKAAASSSSSPVPGERAIVTKARNIVLPEFKANGVTLVEALKQLTDASTRHDPKNEGFNFMVTAPAETVAHAKVTLALKNVTVLEVVERISKDTGISMSARDYAFVFEPKQ